MPQLRLELVQSAAGDVMNIQGTSRSHKKPLHEWQLHFTKQFKNLIKRVGRLRNYKVLAELFEALIIVQQKVRRVSITLQDKVDKETEKLLGISKKSASVRTNTTFRK